MAMVTMAMVMDMERNRYLNNDIYFLCKLSF